MWSLTSRPEWQFFAILPRVHTLLAGAWWTLLVLRGVLPALLALAMGAMIGVVQRHESLTVPLLILGIIFVLLQVLPPLQQAVSTNLGWRISTWLNEQLTIACVTPPGIGHLENSELTNDLTVAREFDRGMTGPPMFINVDFIAGGLVGLIGGVVSALLLFGFAWWAPLVLLGAWFSTHWLLRESGVWRDRNTDEVRLAQRHADYTYRLAVDAPAAKELRLFGLEQWTIDRFLQRRRRLFALQYAATRLRERSVLGALVLVVLGNGLVFWALEVAALNGTLPLDRLVAYAQLAMGVSMIAFGGLNWALDGAAAPVAAVLRLRPAMAPAGALLQGQQQPAQTAPRQEIVVRDLHFTYPGTSRPIYAGLNLTIPAGTSLAIVGQNGAGKTTLAKLLCRLYDPTSGEIVIDGVPLPALDLAAWRSQITAVFQDFIRFELSLRENVAPHGAPDDVIRVALAAAGADHLADLDTPLAKGYANGTDLSGGQWQRVALARALCAIQQGAGLVLLDEPTAALDVRGEAAIFDQLLTASRNVTTILISHRFSTVRHADRIAVLEHGRVIELGSHDELIALGGRYREMFDLQASRFAAITDEEGVIYEQLPG